MELGIFSTTKRTLHSAGSYDFLDTVANGTQAIALSWNQAPAHLAVLQTMCDARRCHYESLGF